MSIARHVTGLTGASGRLVQLFGRREFLYQVLDIAEKAIFTVLFLLLLRRMIASYVANGSSIDLLYIVDQSIVLVFMLVRRPAVVISTRGGEWVAGLGGTFLPLLMKPAGGGSALLPPLATMAILLAGTAVHLSAKLTLRRSFGIVAANRGVSDRGPYRLVRHPMYLGYMLGEAAFLLAGPSLWNGLILATVWAIFVWRIRAEERVLRADTRYRDLIVRTRYRLIPGVW